MSGNTFRVLTELQTSHSLLSWWDLQESERHPGPRAMKKPSRFRLGFFPISKGAWGLSSFVEVDPPVKYVQHPMGVLGDIVFVSD